MIVSLAEILTGKEKIFSLPSASCKVASLPVGDARYVSLFLNKYYLLLFVLGFSCRPWDLCCVIGTFHRADSLTLVCGLSRSLACGISVSLSGIESMCPALHGGFLTTKPWGSPKICLFLLGSVLLPSGMCVRVPPSGFLTAF